MKRIKYEQQVPLCSALPVCMIFASTLVPLSINRMHQQERLSIIMLKSFLLLLLLLYSSAVLFLNFLKGIVPTITLILFLSLLIIDCITTTFFIGKCIII